MEAVMGRLIIDDTTIYELDEECMERKEREKRAAGTAGKKGVQSNASARDKVKEKPAP